MLSVKGCSGSNLVLIRVTYETVAIGGGKSTAELYARRVGGGYAHASDVEERSMCSVHKIKSRYRYRMQRDEMRTKRGPVPFSRQFCKVRALMLSSSAARDSFRNRSGSGSPEGWAEALGCTTVLTLGS